MKTEFIYTLTAVFCLGASPSLALAAPDAARPAGTLKVVLGYPKVRIESQSGVREVVSKAPIFVNDKITTTIDQSIVIVLDEATEVTIGPSTSLVIEVYSFGEPRTSTLGLLYGMIRTWVRKHYIDGSAFTIRTPSASMAVRGTKFIAETRSGAAESVLHTFEGRVAFATETATLHDPSHSVVVGAGSTSSLAAGATVPARPQAFDLKKYQSELRKRAPLFEQLLSEADAASDSGKPQESGVNTDEKLQFPNGFQKEKKKR